MVVRMRSTRGHTGNRRSHHALSLPRLSVCQNCGKALMNHHLCNTCGKYSGNLIVDVAKKIEKREAKLKARQQAAKK